MLGNLGNRLVDKLLSAERGDVMAACNLVELSFGQIIYEKDCSITHVSFPLTPSISEVKQMNKHSPLRMMQIGNEGMLGATLVLGVNTAPLSAVVRVPGSALRMDARNFHDTLPKRH
jgi:hypothetical protein